MAVAASMFAYPQVTALENVSARNSFLKSPKLKILTPKAMLSQLIFLRLALSSCIINSTGSAKGPIRILGKYKI